MKKSVLAPAYNASRYLERAIKSVLVQHAPDFEHIVVDGGSTDGTQEILGQHGHIKWISEKDRGQSDAMNKAYGLSSGDIIVFPNADDWFEPGVFAHVRALFAPVSWVIFEPSPPTPLASACPKTCLAKWYSLSVKFGRMHCPKPYKFAVPIRSERRKGGNE